MRPPGARGRGLLGETIAGIGPVSARARSEAEALHVRLTTPPGALGALEDLGTRLAGVYGACPPPLPEPVAVAVFAADHGVHAQGVSPWPQEVTAQMVGNLAAGRAVVCALARQVGASVRVVDVGVAADLPVAADGDVGRAVHVPDAARRERRRPEALAALALLVVAPAVDGALRDRARVAFADRNLVGVLDLELREVGRAQRRAPAEPELVLVDRAGAGAAGGDLPDVGGDLDRRELALERPVRVLAGVELADLPGVARAPAPHRAVVEGRRRCGSRPAVTSWT